MLGLELGIAYLVADWPMANSLAVPGVRGQGGQHIKVVDYGYLLMHLQ